MVFIDNLGIGARQIHFKSPLSDYLDWGRAHLHTVDTMKPQKISVLPRTFYNLIRLVCVYDPKTHIKHNITPNHGQSDGEESGPCCAHCAPPAASSL